MLDLGGTKVTGPGLAALDEVDRLRTLALGASQVDEAGLAHLLKIGGLKNLVVAGVDFPRGVTPKLTELPGDLSLIVLIGERPLAFSDGAPASGDPTG